MAQLYDPDIKERKLTYERCRKVSSSISDSLSVVERLRERERKCDSVEARVEILAAITDTLMQAERYTDALESSRQIEELASDGKNYVAGILLGAGLKFLTYVNRIRSQERPKKDDVISIRKYFVQTFRLCQKVANTDKYCNLDEQFIQRCCEESIVNMSLLFQLQEFRAFSFWYLSRSKECMASLEFLQSGLQTVGDCVGTAELHFTLGTYFFKSAEKENDVAKMESAMHHLWTSGRTFASQQKDGSEYETVFACQSFELAVGAATISKYLDKASLILTEALKTTQVRNRSKSKLWKQLFLLALSYEAEKRYSEAIDLFETGLTFAQLLEVEEQRTLWVVRIECQLGYSLAMEFCRDPVGSMQEQGLDLLWRACSNLGDPPPNSTSGHPFLEKFLQLFVEVRTMLGAVLELHGKHQEAFELFELCSHICPELKFQRLLKVMSARAKFHAGAQEEGLVVCEAAIAAVKNDDSDMVLQGYCMIIHSELLRLNGQNDKSLQAMEKAKSLIVESNILESPTGYMGFFEDIITFYLKGLYLSSAFDLVQIVESATSNRCRDQVSSRSQWQSLMAKFYTCMLDKQEAQNWMELYQYGHVAENEAEDEYVVDMRAWESIIGKEEIDPDLTPIRLSVTQRVHDALLASQFCSRKEAKMKKLREAKELVKNEWGDATIEMAKISTMVASSYAKLGKDQLADEEFESAMKIFEAMEDKSQIGSMLGYCYLNQANKMARLGRFDEVGDWINRARSWLQEAECQKRRSFLNFQYGASQEIRKRFGREYIKLIVQEERQYSSQMESLAVGNLDLHIQSYRAMESYALSDKDNKEALLWAERSRMRLFMRIAEEQRADSTDIESGDFDLDDSYAEATITSVMEQLGTNSAVIEYSYSEEDNAPCTGLLFIYVVYLVKGKLTVVFMTAKLLAKLKEKWPDKNLAAFVDLVIEEITSEKEGDVQAKEYLSFLHEVLLMGDITALLPPRCDTLVLAPHGHLSLLPFHALYDKGKDEYLIQQKNVSSIPSLRILGHCLKLQRMHKPKTLQPAFVAGNPHPMGCNMPPLPAAEKEAIEVAEILGVQPCVREQMNKEAVKQGLCGSLVVLLATHAECQSPGYVVLQGVKSKARERNATDDMHEKEMLTAAEISKFVVSADLVVLDGCETGRGEVRWEGVLGLGRSVLQAGATTVILSLWKVNDESTRILVTRMFRIARAGTKSVAESLREAMLNMMQERNIYHWAPLIAMGSPTLCINEHISEVEEGRFDKDKEVQTSYSTSVPPTLLVEHKSIGCDGCKEFPLTGPRFMAKPSLWQGTSYDLCLTCFTEKGCSTRDFDRFDIPKN